MSNPQQAVFNYQDEAQQTKSDKFYGDLVDKDYFRNELCMAIGYLQSLDIIKKALFYGRVNSANILSITGNDCKNIHTNFLVGEQNSVDLIHAIIGKATEAGELLELLHDVVFDIKPFDKTNFKEEIADGMWYDAIGLTAVGSNIEEVQRTNIAKLRARFPNKFTEYDANNRNLVAERKILES